MKEEQEKDKEQFPFVRSEYHGYHIPYCLAEKQIVA